MAFGVPPLQSPPPNTAITVFVTVPGTTPANNVYWNSQCKAIPTDATFLVLDMGYVRDFFKPVEGTSMCQMLTSLNRHQWSPNGVDWRIPTYYTNTDYNGGSAADWPKTTIDGDARGYVSFWGNDNNGNQGGCCSRSYTDYTTGSQWGQTYTLAYGVPLQPPPSKTDITIFVDTDGTIDLNDAYWNEKCKEIPVGTLFLMLTMGNVRDFFSLAGNATWCQMLTSHDKYLFSTNGLDWATPMYSGDIGDNGGSKTNWPVLRFSCLI
jgi:hypothetical protein